MSINILVCGNKYLFPASHKYLKNELEKLEEKYQKNNQIFKYNLIIKDLTSSSSNNENNFEYYCQQAHIIIPFMTRFDKELIDKCKNAKLIIQYGVGVEGIDKEYCKEKKIFVSNILSFFNGNSQSCAEHCLFLTFNLLRRLNYLSSSFQNQSLGYPLGETLYKNKVLIYGYGDISRQLLLRLSMFECKEIIVVCKTLPNNNTINQIEEEKKDNENTLSSINNELESWTSLPFTLDLSSEEDNIIIKQKIENDQKEILEKEQNEDDFEKKHPDLEFFFEDEDEDEGDEEEDNNKNDKKKEEDRKLYEKNKRDFIEKQIQLIKNLKFITTEEFFSSESINKFSSRIVYINCSQNKDNLGLINDNFLQRFNRNIYLINVARVSIILFQL